MRKDRDKPQSTMKEESLSVPHPRARERKTRNRKRRLRKTSRRMEKKHLRDPCLPICSSTITGDPSLRKNTPVMWHGLLQLIDLSLPEVSKMIGEEWRKLTEDQQKVSTI